ncbi:hypothetical protein NL676_001486 [Syzygium grande]|nr:hypothetical protein NL676_001486 [Syzygium grande]
MMEAKERAELLGRADRDSAHVLRIFDEEAQAMQSARNSSRMLEESFATGVAILSKYSEQRERLKKAQRRALDILNTVGLSNSVLKLVERRHHVDKWIKYAGMILTVIMLYAFWRWTSCSQVCGVDEISLPSGLHHDEIMSLVCFRGCFRRLLKELYC